MEELIREGRSLKETPTWSVAAVTTVMVFLCFFAQRSIYKFGKWLKKTRRKALFASLEKIKEELMLLGLISLLLGQWASVISRICLDSSLFSSKFFLCSEEDFEIKGHITLKNSMFMNETEDPPKGINFPVTHHCGKGREPFVSHEGLEQLNRFLFVLGITHVLYSCLAVGLAMSKIYSWRKWEYLASVSAQINFQDSLGVLFRSQITLHFDWVSSPWIHNLPLSYNFHNYMVRSMEEEFYGMVGISWPLWGYAIICIFINIHGLNIYFWIAFIPAILAMLVGTKQQHIVSLLALEIVEPKDPSVGSQVKPSDDLFWFGKPEILLRLIQFISFQNAFEMATFIWSLWGLKQQSCFMKNHTMIIIRLACGIMVQFWCSYSTVPLNVIITQMGSRCKKALIAESVRDSLHSWCKRVKERSKRDAVNSIATRSTCSLGSTIDEGDEIITVVSPTISPCSSNASLNQLCMPSTDQPSGGLDQFEHGHSFRTSEYASHDVNNGDVEDGELGKTETLFELLRKT